MFLLALLYFSSSEDQLHQNCPIVPVKLRVRPKLVETTAMIDTCAEGYVFVNTSIASHHHFPFRPVTKLMILHGFCGHQNSHLGKQVLAAKLQVGTIHKEFNALLFATKIDTYPVILGISWVERTLSPCQQDPTAFSSTPRHPTSLTIEKWLPSQSLPSCLLG